MANSPSILKALNLLNKTTEVETNSPTAFVLPTASSREYLNKLFMSKPQDYADGDVKALLQNILNWNGQNKTNKPLMRVFREFINNPETFSQTVEFTGFAAALSPLLEADHFVQLYESCIPATSTAFAPTLYTMNFHKNIQAVLGDLSANRVVKIADSVWKESHRGRWWNMTAGVDNVQEEQPKIEPKKLLNSLKNYQKDGEMENIIWSEENQNSFSEYMKKRLDQDVAKISESFRQDLMEGKPVTPDIAIFLSAIFWLAPSQRPESPINSLLRTLAKFKEIETQTDNFIANTKPNSIKDMFPNLSLNKDLSFGFPFDRHVMETMGRGEFLGNINEKVEVFELIKNRNSLAQNAHHMGNCTLTYQKNMERGEYALYYIKTDKKEYNLSIVLRSYGGREKRWVLGELNSRHNKFGVPEDLRKVVERQIQAIPVPNQNYYDFIKQFDKKSENTCISYEYIV